MLNQTLGVVLAIVGSYILGSIPTGYWYGRLRGIDIRKQGSGNLGATNVLRVLGKTAGVLVLSVDVAKGFLAVALLPHLTPFPGLDYVRVACGLAAVLGHTYTLFLQFKGGKGVATTYGVLLALAPVSTILVFLAFVAVVAFSKYVSLGSLVSAVLFPIFIWLLGESGQGFSILFLALVVGTAVVAKHRSNIRRILDGTENRLGKSAAPGEKPKGGGQA
ncbi:MAG: glycerol-3-phosphate 1-O-acyltransferase PlsY [Candidatus Firestonebacteria bacterium]|nr:glycerol-3-phosphate 1-O-acyltransferase PlsY [Candidatus Firestonebacteria bacterium]